LDPITDLFQTLQIVGVVHARLEATAPWGLKRDADVAAEVSKGKHSGECARSPFDFAHFGMLSRGSFQLPSVGRCAFSGSVLCNQHHAEPCFALHHASVSIGSLFERNVADCVCLLAASTLMLSSTMPQGIGGLGHLGIQFARHMGFRTVAIGRGREKEKLAKDLGAHVYIDTAAEDTVAVLQRMGGARAILATGTSGNAMGSLVSGLAARGKLIVVGVPQDQIQLNAFPLVFGGRSIYASLTGTPIDGEDTLAFSVLENIRPMIETVPAGRPG
jgi:Zinc-binding dehydrogenase